MFTNLSPDLAGDRTQPEESERLMLLLRNALDEGSVVKLLLSKYRGEEPALERVIVRPVVLRGAARLSFVWRYATRDVTKNHEPAEALALIQGLIKGPFEHAHLFTRSHEVQLAVNRKGRARLQVGRAQQAQADDQLAEHDEAKPRHLDMAAPMWRELGLTHEHKGKLQLVPAMARKWRQIDKFVEIFAGALKAAALDEASEVRVADFGSGKGYLTFAMFAWLRSLGRAAHVTGVELREDMVKLCNGVAEQQGLAGLQFEQGDVRHHQPVGLNVMIALHACDIATDFAIHFGLRAGANIIMCSPCCHKQLRPQMKLPPLLRPMLQHGIHLGQEAEMVTDSLRALLLEAEGYETQVFEFVALEHTSKNKMILAVKKQGAALAVARGRAPEVLAQIAEIKRFYGVKEQALESLIQSGAA